MTSLACCRSSADTQCRSRRPGRAPSRRSEDVVGLDVSMDDPARMRVRQGGGDVDEDGFRSLGREAAVLAHRQFQRAPRDVLHDERESEGRQALDRVHRHDIGMLELRDRAGLDELPRDRGFIDAGGRVDNLDGHLAAQLSIAREIHDGHAAASQLSEYLVLGFQSRISSSAASCSTALSLPEPENHLTHLDLITIAEHAATMRGVEGFAVDHDRIGLREIASFSTDHLT